MKLKLIIVLCTVVIVCAIISLCFALNRDVFKQIKEGDLCTDDNYNNGVCLRIDKCLSALEDLKNTIYPTICGFDNRISIVCCINVSSPFETTVESVIYSKVEKKLGGLDNINSTSTTSMSIAETSTEGERDITTDYSCTDGNGACKTTETDTTSTYSTTTYSDEPTLAKITEASINLGFTNVINSTDNSTNTVGEISKTKCKEYATYSYRNISSPVLSARPQYEKMYDCQVNAEILTIKKVEALRQEFPHMAHIGFPNGDNEPVYLCGGSLISEKFVLTVGSCLFIKHWGSPILVRLGITNVDDHDHLQIINIETYFKPLKFSPAEQYNDIGLLKLEKPAELNHFVRPACISAIRDVNYKTAVVTSWGVNKHNGQAGKDLLKSILNLFPNTACKEFVTKKEALEEDLIICAGITSDQRNNPCKGDAGAPLQVRLYDNEELQCMYSIIGLTSTGKSCETIGEPSIFTRVSAYVDWIERTVWPDLI